MVMKYFDAFSGIGGFSLGIQQAYENYIYRSNRETEIKNKATSFKGLEECEQNTQRPRYKSSRNNRQTSVCINYSENKKQKSYENKRIEKQNTVSQRGQKKIRDTGDGHNETTGNLRYSGQPSQECVGYSEIDSECDRCKKAGRGKYQPKTLISKTRIRCDTCGAEKEHPALQIYERQFKHKNYGDITKIKASELPDFDLFCGGFPCQSFSIAGKRLGFEDTRGTLFFDIARIVKEKRPKYLLLENVKGLLSHDNGRTFKIILSTLTKLGYDLEWQVLNSKNFGVPQNRERVFIIGYFRGTSRGKVFPIGKTNENTNAKCKQINNPTHSNDRVYGTEGISPTLNTMQGGRRQPFIYDDYNSKPKKDNISCTLTPNTGSKALRNGQKVVLPVLTPDRINKRQKGRRMKENGEPMFTLTGQDQHGVVIIDKKGKPKNKNYASTLSGGAHSGGNHSDMDLLAMRWQRTEKGKKARRESQKKGRDYTPFSDGHRELVPVKGKPVGALTAQAVAKDSLIGNDTRIRRLTPIECERLQGFPDGWTEKGIDENGNEVVISDTQRYKTLGNAVSCPVIVAIVKRLLL